MIACGIVIPLMLMLLLMEHEARTVIGAMISGIIMCLFAGELNAWVMRELNVSYYYATTSITPIIEELLKGQIVLYFAVYFCPKRDKLIAVSMAVGIGFALMENVNVFVHEGSDLTLQVALGRGLASGLMHGICTTLVGYGISYIRYRKKLFFTGIFGLLSAACIYHAMFNALVQSEYMWIGFIMPIVTYIPSVMLIRYERNRKKGKQESSEA